MFSIKSRKLPYARSYAQAEELFDRMLRRLTARQKASSAPWSDRCVPLKNARSRHFKLERRMDGDVVCYDFIYHRTTVVSHRSDGSIDMDVTYDSVSTRAFFDCFCPESVVVQSKRGYKWLVHHKNPGQLFYSTSKPLRFTAGGDIEGAEPVELTKRLVDRDKAKLLRVKLKPYVKWLTAVSKACDSVAGACLGMVPESKYGGVMPSSARHKLSALVCRLLDGDTDFDLYREVSGCLLACLFAKRSIEWETLSHDERYDILRLPRMVRVLHDVAYKLEDAFVQETVVVQPGETP